MWSWLELVSLVLTGIAAGILCGVALANVPAFAALTVQQYAGVHQVLDRHYEPTMPLIVGLSLLADVGLTVGVDHLEDRVLFAGAAVALAGVAAVSQFANVPLLSSLRTLDVDRIPTDWPDPRPRWRRWHLARTALACLAFVATAAATAF